MIEASELIKAGFFTKTHGIHGELNAFLDVEPEFFESHDCFFCFEEGIPTPFFIDSYRPKGSSSALIKPCYIESETDAKSFMGKELYINKKEYRVFLDENPDSEGEYASDMIGWTIYDAVTNREIGTIEEVNLQTANPLFIVRSNDSDTSVMIPIAEEFIASIEENNKRIIMTLPEGLLDLNAK